MFPFVCLIGITDWLYPTGTLDSVSYHFVPKSFSPCFSILLSGTNIQQSSLIRPEMWKGAILEAFLSLVCFQINWSLADLCWVWLGLVLSYTLDPATPCVSSLPWTSRPPKACYYDDTKLRRPRPTVEAHFKPLLMSHPLVPFWPKQVLWSSLELRVGKYVLPSQMVRLNVNEVGWVLLPGVWRAESLYLLNKSPRYYLGDVLKGEEKKIPL